MYYQANNLDALYELLTSLVKLPDLIEELFRRLVEGDYTIQEAERVFPSYFYNFLRANLNDDHLRRKIDKADIEKFIKPKLILIALEIIDKLPLEF